jgi:hypothetical protein
MGARCLWCLRSDGGAANAASSPSVERPTRVRMSVRMVTRFVYVRVCGGLLEVPKALWRAVRFARECGGGVCCSRSCKGGRGRARRGCVARTGRRATQSYFLRPKREQEA